MMASPQEAGWIVLLTAAVILFSFALACATPFPALAALAAWHPSRSDALALTGQVNALAFIALSLIQSLRLSLVGSSGAIYTGNLLPRHSRCIRPPELCV